MPIFKKRYTEDQIRTLQIEILQLNPSKEDVTLFNTLQRMQVLSNKVKELKQATGQDVLVFDDLMFKLNEDGTLIFNNLDKNFTYSDDE